MIKTGMLLAKTTKCQVTTRIAKQTLGKKMFFFLPANLEDSCWILYTVLASRTTSITPT